MSFAVVVIVVALTIAVLAYNSTSYIAKVASEKIKVYEYKVYLNLVKSEMEKEAEILEQEQSVKENFWKGKSEETGKYREEEAKEKALENIKEYKIQLLKAKEAGVVLSPQRSDDIEAELDYYIQDEEKKKEFEENLKEYDVTFKEYIEFYKNMQTIKDFKTDYMMDKSPELEVTDEQIKQYYDENRIIFDNVTYKQIKFNILEEDKSKMSEDKLKEVETKALNALKRVNNGEDMDALIAELSEDESVIYNQGKLSIRKGDLIDELADVENWAFSSEVGDTTLIKTDVGYYVVKLDNKKIDYEYNKTDAKNRLKLKLLDEAYNQALNEWKLDSKYNIIKNDKVYDAIKVLK